MASAEAFEVDETGAGVDGEPARKKRGPVSCLECRRRKTKCDRKLPCTPCIERGDANGCSGARPVSSTLSMQHALTAAIDSSPGGFVPASAAALQDLALRLLRLERMIEGRAPVEDATAHEDVIEQAVASLEDATIPIAERKYETRAPVIGPTAAAHREASTICVPSDGLRPNGAVAGVMASQLAALVGCLPSDHDCRVLVRAFFDHVHWLVSVLHSALAHEPQELTQAAPSFEAEFETFLRSRSNPSAMAAIDPAWLGLFSIVLVLGARALASGFASTAPIDPRVCHRDLFEVSRCALALAEWTARPQFRTLQTIILYSARLHYGGSPFCALDEDRAVGEGMHLKVWITAAIPIARQLGLDRLVDAPDSMPAADDLAFPTGPTAIKRQVSRQLWHWLVTISLKMSGGDAPLLPSDSYTTPLPDRCNDADVGRALDIRAASGTTQLDFTHYQFYLAQHIRQSSEMARSRPSDRKASYELLTQLDVVLRTRIRTLLGHDIGAPVDLSLPLPSLVVEAGCASRLLRLHRPWFVAGLTNPAFAASTQSCVASAKTVIAIETSAVYAQSRCHCFWWLYAHALSAIVVLYIARFHTIEQLGIRAGMDDLETGEVDRGVAGCRATFERAKTAAPQSSLRSMASRCIRVIDLLAEVERQRRAGGKAEPIGNLLRRIASMVDSEASDQPVASTSGNIIVPPAMQFPAIEDDGLFGLLTGPSSSYLAPDGSLDAVQFAAREWGTYTGAWDGTMSFGPW